MRDYIVITGGELYNKGAQAMTFNVINRLKKIYPQKKIILMSLDYYRSEEEKQIYNFEFAPYSFELYMNLAYGKIIYKKNKYTKNLKFETEQTKKILANSFVNIDVSGFKLSSQTGLGVSTLFLLERKIMEKFKIRQFILPQSFGPFNYKSPSKFIIKNYLMKYMKEPEIIFCREKQGIKYMSRYSNKLKLAYDTVLYDNEYNFDYIFKNEIKLKEFNVEKNSVGLVPNSKLNQHNNVNDITYMYKKLISLLLKKNKNVYIFRHSVEDLNFCREIKELFSNEEKVILIEDDLNSFELKNLISKFQYIIASRYHAIIHGYLTGTPAMIIGWSFKYEELALNFKQDNIIYDIRNELQDETLRNSIYYIDTHHRQLSDQIKITLNIIKEDDIFDVLEQEINKKDN